MNYITGLKCWMYALEFCIKNPTATGAELIIPWTGGLPPLSLYLTPMTMEC